MTGPVVPLEQRMLEAECRARVEAERRGRKLSGRIGSSETRARLQYLVGAGVVMADEFGESQLREALSELAGAGAQRIADGVVDGRRLPDGPTEGTTSRSLPSR